MADLDYAGQHPMSLIVQPAGLSVSAWSELRGGRKLPGRIRVLVDRQHAGGAERWGGVGGLLAHRSLWPWPLVRPDHRASDRRGSCGRCRQVGVGAASRCA